MSLQRAIDGYEAFIQKTSRGLERARIDRSKLAMMDTICYRAGSLRTYKSVLANIGGSMLVGVQEVGGRPIATIELEEPLEAEGWKVSYLELPAPKEGTPYPEGLEHAQFVTVGSLGRFEQRHPHIVFDRGGMGNPLNPMLGLKTTYLSAKFHELPLGTVVRIQNHPKIHIDR